MISHLSFWFAGGRQCCQCHNNRMRHANFGNSTREGSHASGHEELEPGGLDDHQLDNPAGVATPVVEPLVDRREDVVQDGLAEAKR
jgi:hypothetical protein